MGRLARLAPVTLGVLFLAATCVHGNSMERQEYDLVNYLLHDYFPLVRPVADHRDVIHVLMDMTLIEIVNMDEKNQIMVLSVWVYQQWKDSHLQWNPHDFNNITQITLPSTDIWKPDIVLYNNANDNLDGGVRKTRALIDSDGTVTWTTPAILMTTCEMNPLFFPFDIQNCSLKFGSWTFHGDQLNLQLNATAADTSKFKGNGEWNLLEMPALREVSYSSCCNEPYPVVTFYVVLERRSLFYMFNLVLPCVLIASIVLPAFFLPSDAGEKVTLTITIMLALTVFLLLVAETIPPTSEVIPLIGQFYAAVIVLVGICASLTVVILSIHHRGDCTHVPRWVHTLFLVKLATILRVRNQISHSSIEMELHAPSSEVGSISPRGGVLNPIFEGDDGIEEQHRHQDDERRGSSSENAASAMMERQLSTGADTNFIEQYVTSISKNVSYLVRRGRDEDSSKKVATEWQEVAMVLDRLFMVVFLFLIALVTLSTLLAAASRVPLW